MSNFIEVESTNTFKGKSGKFLINLQNVLTIKEDDDGTAIIFFNDSTYINVKETYKTIKEVIKCLI